MADHLNASVHGIKRVAADLDPILEQLRLLKEKVPETGLSWHALGVVGVPAALRYGSVVDGFGGKVGDRITQLEKLASDLVTTADGYVKTENANLRILLNQFRTALNDSRVNAHGQEGWNEPGISDDMLSPHHLLDIRSLGLFGGMALGTSGGMLSYPMINDRANALHFARERAQRARSFGFVNDKAEGELSKAAKLSARSNAVFSGASKLTVSALLGLALSLATAIPDDYVLDTAIDRWTEIADELDDIFGANGLSQREALAQAWESEALSPADKKLRDFFTVGYHLADEAVAQANALQDLVKAQNRLHDIALVVSYTEFIIMLGLSVVSFFNPAGKIALAVEGTKLTNFMIFIHAAIAAAGAAYLATIVKGNPGDAPPAVEV
ncbi:hypothetical protein OHA77_30465 [Streptosporangium sp. NBC_01639]|uniref:hypothetical protein n=1 Tax=Streptosporangium sp. NBC_01639 TaxID=2975948 RepID=UPI00386D23E9|nr:hypothetical protein OHA77_30465 [Streptosporangium sp. NBC_01639]